jgi:succinate-semialdehyde dehydrogenase/glutarate-semialdehyde dehydrogenase
VLVFADADLDIAVRESITAKFRNTGQSCIAANRIYVQHAVYEEFLDKFTAATRALKLGDGLTDGVEIGPLIDEAGLQLALEHVEEAVAGGAGVQCGGRRWPGSPGCFLEPTVLTDVAAGARCLQEETFAPVAPVLRFADEAEAITLANDTDYGLAAYAFTRDNARCWRLAEQLEAGSIGINDGVLSTSNCPFGGLKQSGLGRELGSEGLDAFLETKHVSFANVDS